MQQHSSISLLPPMPLPPPEDQRLLLTWASAVVVQTVVAAVAIATDPAPDRIPYHTSALSGHDWVLELINGHPDRIKTELGMRKHVFLGLVSALRQCGLQDSRYIALEDKVAIFLYMSVTGLRIRHVGERFQHANATISKYVVMHLQTFMLTIIYIGTTVKSSRHSHHFPSTTPMFISLPETHQSPTTSRTTPRCSPTSRMPWAL